MMVNVSNKKMSSKSLLTRRRKTSRSLKIRKQSRRMMTRNLPSRKKVKIKKRRQWEKAVDLSDQLREEQEIAEANKQESGDHRQHEYLERLAKKENGRGQQTQQMVEFQHADKGLLSERNSWFVSFSHRGLQAE